VAALLAKGKGRSLTAASALIPTLFIPLDGLHRSVYVEGVSNSTIPLASDAQLPATEVMLVRLRELVAQYEM
jgi:hypothetical protein